MKKLELNKLYSIKLIHREEEFSGYLISEGSEWLLFRNNPSDFVLDGYLFVNREYLDSCNREQSEKFVEEVIKLKDDFFQNDLFEYNVNNTNILLEQLELQKETILYNFEDETECFMGRVESNLENKVNITSFSSKGIWKNVIEEDFDDVRAFEIKTDYIKSLLAYNKNIQSI